MIGFLLKIHVRGLLLVLREGQIGNTYNIGGHNEEKNKDVVQMICALLEERVPNKPIGLARYQDLMVYVKDRPGHDCRYAIDASKIKNKLNLATAGEF